MRNLLCLFMLVTLLGAICAAQAPSASDQSAGSGQQSQRPDVYEQGAPPPPEAQLPDIPQQPTDEQERPQAQQPTQPPVPDAEQTENPQDRTPELKKRPEPVKTIPANRTLNAGTEIRASLDRVISSKSSQAGDEFTATIMEPVMNPDGQILVHSGAKIHGRIAGIERGKLFGSLRNASARLNLRFTDIVLENSVPLPVEASLVGINESSTKSKARSNEEGDISSSGGNGKETIRDIGVGAGAGTLAGLLFGSAWKGAIIGALAGGGYVLANQGRDVELPANTGLRIRLDKYLTVPEYALRPEASQPPAAQNDYDQTYDQGAPSMQQPSQDGPVQDDRDRSPRK
ncbi:MAG TPA: glycine zipper family protein [Terriglobales bacterium]